MHPTIVKEPCTCYMQHCNMHWHHQAHTRQLAWLAHLYSSAQLHGACAELHEYCNHAAPRQLTDHTGLHNRAFCMGPCNLLQAQFRTNRADVMDPYGRTPGSLVTEPHLHWPTYTDPRGRRPAAWNYVSS